MLQAVAHNSSALNISWDLPMYPNGPLSHYMVFYRETSTPQTGAIATDGYMQARVNDSEVRNSSLE